MADITEGLRERVTSRLRSRSTSPSPEVDEALVARYFEDYVAAGRGGLRYVLRHPVRSVAALVALRRLPEVTADLSDSNDGVGLHKGLSRSYPIVGRTIVHSATALVMVPTNPADYSIGASKQTLRRKVRAAQKLGVSWTKVDDIETRRHLLELADDRERTHPREDYRREPHNADMLAYGLWLVAQSDDGRPLVLSVTAVDGEWSLLRHFCALGDGPEYSNARYFLTQILVEQLAASGVRYLADAVSPAYLPNGLRSFQRTLGFRIARVRLRPAEVEHR